MSKFLFKLSPSFSRASEWSKITWKAKLGTLKVVDRKKGIIATISNCALLVTEVTVIVGENLLTAVKFYTPCVSYILHSSGIRKWRWFWTWPSLFRLIQWFHSGCHPLKSVQHRIWTNRVEQKTQNFRHVSDHYTLLRELYFPCRT